VSPAQRVWPAWHSSPQLAVKSTTAHANAVMRTWHPDTIRRLIDRMRRYSATAVPARF